MTLFLFALTETITWIKVEKPTFDLVGVVLGSLSLAGALALLALFAGALWGLTLIRRSRATSAGPWRESRVFLDLGQ